MYKQLAILIVHFHLSRIEEMPCQHWTFMRLRDYNVQKFRKSAKMNFPDKTSIKFIFSRFFKKNFSRYYFSFFRDFSKKIFPDILKLKKVVYWHRKFTNINLQMQFPVTYTLSPALIPVLGAYVAACPSCHTHGSLIRIPTVWTFPNQFSILVLYNFNFPVIATNMTIIAFGI